MQRQTDDYMKQHLIILLVVVLQNNIKKGIGKLIKNIPFQHCQIQIGFYSHIFHEIDQLKYRYSKAKDYLSIL